MVIGDAYMLSGTDHGPGQPFNLAAAKDANRLLPYWPDSALEVAQIEAFDSITAGSRRCGRLGGIAPLDGRRREPRLEQPASLDALGRSGRRAQGIRARAVPSITVRSRATSGTTQRSQGLGQLAGMQHNWQEAIHWYRLALAAAVKDQVAAGALRALISGAERSARAGRD